MCNHCTMDNENFEHVFFEIVFFKLRVKLNQKNMISSFQASFSKRNDFENPLGPLVLIVNLSL